MPTKPKRPCNHPGCPALTDTGYCEQHNRHKSYNRQRKDSEAAAFYRSKDWRITSQQFRGMYPQCQACGKPARMVHHEPELVVLLARGDDPLDWSWLKSLCWSCHEATKR